MHKVLLTLLFMLVTLEGCGMGDQSKVENAIRDHLKDPASAQFKNFVISKGGNYACIGWNSRNSMGGYGDWDTAELFKQGSKWIVKAMRASELLCTEESLNTNESLYSIGKP